MKCPHCGKRYANNRTVVVEHNGAPMSLRELAAEVGLAPSTLIGRYGRGHRGDSLIRAADKRYGRKRDSRSLQESMSPVSCGTGGHSQHTAAATQENHNGHV